MSEITIKVEEHADGGFKAYVVEDPVYWAVAKTPLTAIGDLVATFPKKFGVVIDW